MRAPEPRSSAVIPVPHCPNVTVPKSITGYLRSVVRTHRLTRTAWPSRSMDVLAAGNGGSYHGRHSTPSIASTIRSAILHVSGVGYVLGGADQQCRDVPPSILGPVIGREAAFVIVLCADDRRRLGRHNGALFQAVFNSGVCDGNRRGADSAADAAEYRARSERRLGELMAASQKKQGWQGYVGCSLCQT